MNKNKVKVVAFDCDGVMFDSLKANTKYYNTLLSYFGRPQMTAEQLAYVHMHTADEALAFLFDRDERLLAEVEAYRQKMGYLKFIQYMEIDPDLKPLLRRIRPPCKTAVVTNRTDTMDHVLAAHQLEDDFDLVIRALDVTRPKPHPEPLIRVLEHFAIGPHETMYVGDSKVDETAAAQAGIALVAYRNRSLTAAHHIERLREIEGLLFD